LIYNFGARRGQIYRNNNVFDIFHDDIGLITSPTVTSDKFELSIARNISLGSIQINMSSNIKFLISDENFNGDKAPDNNGGYVFNFNNEKIFQPFDFSFNKNDSKDIRVLSYNVLRDNLFNTSLRQNYRRIFQAIKPDIIGFCEIYDNNGTQTAALIESFLPSTANQKWYHAEVNPDIRAVSRFPIVNSRSIDGNGAFHIDMGDKQLLFIVAHLPCCDNDTDRQAEVDKIMAFIRGVKFGISPFNIPINSPIIIVGDMNLVGKKQQLTTFLTGEIANNSSFGPDFRPDWDNTDLEDAKPYTTNLPFTFTWYNDFGSYSAGRLDYVIYTGSQMKLNNSYALWSPALSTVELSNLGLQRDDVPRASDHLPVIADFDISGVTSTSYEREELPISFSQKNGQLIFDSKSNGQILISDNTGKKIYEMNKTESGEIILDIPSISGLFLFSFVTKDNVFSTKFYR
jgi:exonuclease III